MNMESEPVTPNKPSPKPLITVGHKVGLTSYQAIFYYEWLLNPLSNKYNIVWDQSLSGDLNISRLNKSVIRFVKEYLLFSSNIFCELDKLYWVRREVLFENTGLVDYYPDGLSEEGIRKLVLQPFNLERDLLIRIHVIKLGDNRYRLICILPHILIDGANLGFKPDSFIGEIGNYYNDKW